MSLILIAYGTCQKIVLASNLTDVNGKGYFHYLCKSKSSLDRFCYNFKVLQDQGEDINLKDCNGISPLFESIANEYFSWKYVQVLINRGADIRIKDNDGRNLISFALKYRMGSSALCDLLDYFNCIGADFQTFDVAGRTPLHYLFCENICPDTVDTNYGSKLTGMWGTFCLIDNERLESIFSLLTVYADCAGVDCFTTDKRNINPLMLALHHCPNSPYVKQWIKNGIPEHRNKFGETYFHYLVRSNASKDTFKELCSVLVENNVNINSTDSYGRFPLHLCISSGNIENIKNIDTIWC